MDNFMDLLKSRRSVRKYQDKDISEEKLHTILESVRWAQSWANTQCWEIVVVKETAVKEALAETVLKGNPALKSVIAAPVVLVLCAKLQSSGYYKDAVTTKFGDWCLFDIGVAAQNICLCAHSMGIGGVVVGLFDQDKAAAALNVPDGYDVICMIPMGYPLKETSPPKRREVFEFRHDDMF